MKQPYLLAAGLTLALAACTETDTPPPPPPRPDISEALVGTWETIEIRVTAPTYLGSDSTVNDHIREADWGQLYGVLPARTRYTADGKLQRTHRLKGGQVANVTHGLWKPEANDSLFVIEPSITYRYGYELEGDRLTLHGLVDYDQDGEADDDYTAVLRLVSRTE